MQGDRRHQRERRDLADGAHVDPRSPLREQDEPGDQHRDVTDQDQQRGPQREGIDDHEGDQARGDRQPVGDGVQDLAEVGHLPRARGRAPRPPSRSRPRSRTARAPRAWCPGRRSARRTPGSARCGGRRGRSGSSGCGRSGPPRSWRGEPTTTSGRRDSNPRPPVPQTDALTKLRHGPCRGVYPSRGAGPGRRRDALARAAPALAEADDDRDALEVEGAAETALEEPLVARRGGAAPNSTNRGGAAATCVAYRYRIPPGACCSACAAATTSLTLAVGARRFQRSWTCVRTAGRRWTPVPPIAEVRSIGARA